MTLADVVVGHDVAADVACAHCGLLVPPGLVELEAERQFCCAGCRTAWAILHERGLDRYYDLAERREAPVHASGRSYEEFDHPAFHQLYVRPGADGLSRVELYLEGVHCSSCVWLVERVPLILPGLARAELNVRRSLALVEWDGAVTSLSAIARLLDSLGYPAHPFRGVRAEAVRRREDRAMLVRIGVAGAIAGNVMLAALALYSGWLGGMEAEYTRLFRWVSLVLTTVALAGPGRVFLAGAHAALRARTLHMDVPIALGLVAGWAQGATNTVMGTGPVYFDGLATLIFALLVGRYLQQRGQRLAAGAAEMMSSLTPSAARVVVDDAVRELPSAALLPGMLLDVRAGDTLPADGVVCDGRSAIDASLLTGESRPIAVAPGERVFAGTTNLAAALRVRVERAGEPSRLARILRQVEESAERKAPIVQAANRVAAWFVAAVLVLAAGTFVAWWRVDRARAVDNTIALLIVTCPCALALATPLAVSVAVGRAARRGIFIKGGDVIEQLAHPGRLLLDKTGTLTEARTALVRWTGPEWACPLVLALEAASTHPVAAGFRRAWPTVEPGLAREARHTIGGGVEGEVDGRTVVVGSPAFVRARVGCDAPPFAAVGAAVRDAEDDALTPVLVGVDGEVVATAGFGDPVRADAGSALDALRARGWRVGILSGDDPAVVARVGRALGLPPDECIGGASPEDKRCAVERESAMGPVVMVGDGVNDAAAMAAAAVGIGVHGGAEACLATADVYLTEPGLGPLVRLGDGAAATMRVIRRNIAFSLVYNVAGATLAMTGVLDPLIAAVLMPASSLSVVAASWLGAPFREGRS